MTDYTLHCFAQSGHAYKAALMLNLCGLEWQPRFVDYFNGETRTPDYRRLNEMGEVPVLIAGDEKFSQSGVILQYLTDQTGQFGPQNDAERYEILRWLLFDNHKLSSPIGTWRYLLTFAKTGETGGLGIVSQALPRALRDRG
ncbi:MAG: glutathione S-transferase N-terminal domain-containing protein, partial [Hyphomicrobiales bacterium]